MRTFTYLDLESWRVGAGVTAHLPYSWSGSALDLLQVRGVPESLALQAVLVPEALDERLLFGFAYRALNDLDSKDGEIKEELDVFYRYWRGEAIAEELSECARRAEAKAKEDSRRGYYLGNDKQGFLRTIARIVYSRGYGGAYYASTFVASKMQHRNEDKLKKCFELAEREFTINVGCLIPDRTSLWARAFGACWDALLHAKRAVEYEECQIRHVKYLINIIKEFEGITDV